MRLLERWRDTAHARHVARLHKQIEAERAARMQATTAALRWRGCHAGAVRVCDEALEQLSQLGGRVEQLHGELAKARQLVIEKTEAHASASDDAARADRVARQAETRALEAEQQLSLLRLHGGPDETLRRENQLLRAALAEHADRLAIAEGRDSRVVLAPSLRQVPAGAGVAR